MKKTGYTLVLILLLPFLTFAQTKEETRSVSELAIIFDAGLLIGHSNSYYPTPFSSNISFLKKYYDRFWIGAGTGVEVIGKTFIPLFIDFRIVPFKAKPFFIYNKFGGTYCMNKNYSDGSDNNTYYNNYPHPLNENVITTGGLLNECGWGVLLQKNDWTTSLSIGYNYQTTSDKLNTEFKKTYENKFNRVAFRIGFWF